MTTATEVKISVDHYFCGVGFEKALCGARFKESDPFVSGEPRSEAILCRVCEKMDQLEQEYLGGKCCLCGEENCDE